MCVRLLLIDVCTVCFVTVGMCLFICLHTKSVSLNAFYTCASMCESACAITLCERGAGDLSRNRALLSVRLWPRAKILTGTRTLRAGSGRSPDTLAQVPRLKLVVPGISEPAKTGIFFPSSLWSWMYSLSCLPSLQVGNAHSGEYQYKINILLHAPWVIIVLQSGI